MSRKSPRRDPSRRDPLDGQGWYATGCSTGELPVLTNTVSGSAHDRMYGRPDSLRAQRLELIGDIAARLRHRERT